MKIKFFKSVLITACLISTSLFADNKLTQKEKDHGWELLFDGSNLKSHWRNFGEKEISDNWVIKDGAFGITQDAGDILTKKSFDDFEFKIDWKVAEKGNSGIFIRVDESGKRAHSYALEIQILDDENFRDKKGNPPTEKHKSGSIYDILAAKPGNFKGHSTWNSTHVIANGPVVTVYMNGELVAKVDQSSSEYDKLYQNSKFVKLKKISEKFGKATKGPIGLQDHQSEIWFKNAKIKTL